MSRLNALLKVVVVVAGLVAVGVVVLARLALADIIVGTNLRLNDPKGPDGVLGTEDDEPRRHVEAAIAVHPLEPGRPLAAWIDGQYPGAQPDTVGFNLFDVSASEPWASHEVMWDNATIRRLHGYEWIGGQRDPGTAIGGNGYAYIVALEVTVIPPRLLFMRKPDTDPNTPWELARFFTCEDPNSPCGLLAGTDKPLVTADPTSPALDPVRAKRLFVHWTQKVSGMPGYQIRFFADQEAGARILAPLDGNDTVMIAETNDADPPDPPAEHSDKFGSTSAVGPYGEVHVAWLDMRALNNGADGDIRYRKLKPDLVTWDPKLEPYEPSRLVAPIDDIAEGPTSAATNIEGGRLHSLPSIAVDWGDNHPCTGRRGWVYVVYAAEDTATGRLADIFCVRSRDNGATWDPPVKVNDDTDPEGTIVQVMPWVVVDQMGRVIVQWVDFRDDPFGNNRVYHIYMAVSLDGGYTFPGNEAVTSVPSNTQFGDPMFLGDYNYMAVEPHPADPQAGRAFPIWADLRHRDEQGAEHDTAGDIYAAPVTVTGDLIRHPDLDGDGDVDLTDFSIFQLCFGGSNNPPAPTCPDGVNADLDCDGDVDLADFLIFQQYFTGSGSESQSALGPDELMAMADWCEDKLSRTQRVAFADVLREAVRRRPNASDAPLAAALADTIDPPR